MADTTNQSAEVRAEALRAAPSGSGSATGQAKENDSGQEDERLVGSEDRPAPEGAPERGDYGQVEYAQPVGLQAEPAAFTPGGTIPAGFVASPSGFVPASTVANPEEAIETTLGKQKVAAPPRKLTQEEVEALDGPTVRAIGAQRGYQMPDMAGSRTARARFLAEQDKDPAFKKEEKAKK